MKQLEVVLASISRLFDKQTSEYRAYDRYTGTGNVEIEVGRREPILTTSEFEEKFNIA